MEKYVGAWKDNKKHGEGVLTTICNEKYEGTFVDDQE